MSDPEKTTFQSAKYGEVSVGRDEILTFPSGLPGFERCRRYGLVALEEEAPFLRLLSMDNPSVGFVLLNPLLVWADYDPQIGKEDLEALEITSSEELAIYCILTLSPLPQRVTANLKGPILINTRIQQARQMILVDERYHTKHSILAAGQASSQG
ncbi:MAG: flagellar assembly protein FliW [Candidatus Handelsmanbacteria bacterium]|nr:flagellar assembly protein FliW [Candidatus Handelsmanbacteria bacterium]